MMKRAINPRLWQVAAIALCAIAAFAIAAGCGGCDSNTAPPSHVPFPARKDRLVLKLPDKPAEAMNTATHRDDEIATLDEHGGRTSDPAVVSAEVRDTLNTFLKDTFGTPGAPVDVSATLKLSKDHISEGARLYKKVCADCHNSTGDGRGAKSGQTIVPFPRDYRQGVFKFVTSGEGMKPRRADLLRTIHDGLKGTAMPPSSLLQEGERDLLAGYVMYLSIRGQVEFESLRALVEGQPNDPAARLKAILAEWEKAETAPALPSLPDDGELGSPQFEEAVRRGYQLFTAKKDNSCISCHGAFGRKPVLRYEVWGTVAKPANFTETNFKGGSRPEDVYARIRFGIPSVGMPAHGPPQYSERDVWDLVRFTTSAPYPVRLPKDVKDAVYPNP